MFGIKFIKVQPTTYLLQYRRGKLAREGVGLSFFYYSPTTSLVAVPVASTDTPFIFQETTADFQTVTIQGQVTYRVSDPKQLASLLNYSLRPDGETYVSEDPEKLSERVIHVINVLARAELQKLPLREAIRASDEVVQSVKAGLVGSQEITSLGLEVLVFRFWRLSQHLRRPGRSRPRLARICSEKPTRRSMPVGTRR
jgi:regulator of protease activity HflC (stomatin/prohibitin superfamily)